jgi:hypothetical protein
MFIPDPRSDFFSITDPGSEFFHPGSESKNLSILTRILFLSSQKYDPDPDFLSIPDPNSQHCLKRLAAKLNVAKQYSLGLNPSMLRQIRI